uniref:Uncharacterized protein n=1 Tax=Timema monikensis TaxID=170555 RepID=A0A7R9HHW4_9NEOP|nr:unnamed protein product [Timema monikensis]
MVLWSAGQQLALLGLDADEIICHGEYISPLMLPNGFDAHFPDTRREIVQKTCQPPICQGGLKEILTTFSDVVTLSEHLLDESEVVKKNGSSLWESVGMRTQVFGNAEEQEWLVFCSFEPGLLVFPWLSGVVLAESSNYGVVFYLAGLFVEFTTSLPEDFLYSRTTSGSVYRFLNGLCLSFAPEFQPTPSADDRGPCLSFRTFELSRHLPHVGIPSQSIRYIFIPIGDLQSFSLSTYKGS